MVVHPLTNAILIGLEADPIPGGDMWVKITDPTNAHTFLNTAIGFLPDQGGTLYVSPMANGTAEYRIAGQVNVDKPNVTIEFLGGSEPTFPATGSSPQNMFFVTGSGFRCIGARVKYAIKDDNLGLLERSFFRVEADDAEFLDCSFDIKQDVSSPLVVIKSSSCIRLFVDLTQSDARRNLKVGRCTFVLQPGTSQGLPWIQPPVGLTEPRGVCCIRATGLLGGILTENHFRSGSTTVKGDCGPILYLLDVEQCAVSANTARGLRTPSGGSAPDRGTLVRIRGDRLEGHHTVVSCNVCEDLETSHAVVLDKVRFDYVTGNVFDLIGPGCFSVIHARDGDVLGIVANAITRPAAAVSPEGAIHLENVRDVTLSGNALAGIPSAMKPIAIVGGGNVQVSPYQALISTP